MSDLINTILETNAIKEIKPDFSRLTYIPKEIAQKTQILVFEEKTRKELSFLTTNNFPEDVKRILQQFSNKGYNNKVYYTSNE